MKDVNHKSRIMVMIDSALKRPISGGMPDHASIEQTLLTLSRDLGREDRGLAILGEGNTSARLTEETFLVKASGSSLGTLSPAGVTACRFDRLIPLLRAKGMTDVAIDEALLAARVDPAARKPSVEAVFHAYLLSLPGVDFIGHTHPIGVNGLLCSDQARTFARRRIFPDQVVCCGVESVFVPNTDPGLKLAQAIEKAVTTFIGRLSRPPRVILLENHGLIALGGTPEAVLAATLMAEKSARIFAAAPGGPRFLTPAQVARVAGRPDELYRQKVLGL